MKIVYLLWKIFQNNKIMTDEIKINLEGRILPVKKSAYVKVKTKDLREFGYTSLTEEDVSNQLEKVINGEELSVIGMFIEKDIIK